MARSGYFTGDIGGTVALDGVCVLEPSYENSPIVDAPTTAGHVYIFRIGQDFHTLRVRGGCPRHNQGDGEWWAYNHLLWGLGGMGKGTLTIEDRRYPGCFFLKGKATCKCRRGAITNEAWVDYDLTFLQSRQEMPVSIAAAGGEYPSPIAEYAARNSNRTYTFGGTSLGLISDEGLTVSVDREVLVNPIPKAYGVRVEDLAYGLKISLDLTMSYKADTHGDWNKWWMELVANKGDEPAALVGNGNTFDNCHMLSASAPRGGDQFGHVKAGNFRLQFLQSLMV